MKVLIIGGGASGMMAALSAAGTRENTVILLERQARLGKKLMATGNGRCNLTNRALEPSRYHGADAGFALPALRRFGTERALAFFAGLGLLTVTEENGKVYPLSDQANSVVDVLRFALDARGVQTVCSCDVVEVKKKARGYQALAATGERYFGDKLIVCCGGWAGKKLGGSRAGYHLLSQFGHSCTPLYPCLTQLCTDPTWVRALKGVRADAALTLLQNSVPAAQSAGELQFTDFGVSGPEAFAVSRAASVFSGRQALQLDFLRAWPEEAVLTLLKRRQAGFPALAAEELLSGMLQARLGKTIVRRCGIDGRKPLAELAQEELLRCARMIKCFCLDVTGVMGFDSAQVTAGGVPTAEFDAQTLESRLSPGVYAAGEVLDIDGDCGGFNLQWAWASGYVAGQLGKAEENAL